MHRSPLLVPTSRVPPPLGQSCVLSRAPLAWQSLTLSALTLIPALIVRADGKHIRLVLLFIPEWMGYG